MGRHVGSQISMRFNSLNLRASTVSHCSFSDNRGADLNALPLACVLLRPSPGSKLLMMSAKQLREGRRGGDVTGKQCRLYVQVFFDLKGGSRLCD